MNIFAICSMAFTTIMTGVITLMLKHMDNKMDKDRRDRIERDIVLFNGTDASLKLGIDMGRELQRTNKVNGNTDMALIYAEKRKHELNSFFVHQGAENLNKA